MPASDIDVSDRIEEPQRHSGVSCGSFIELKKVRLMHLAIVTQHNFKFSQERLSNARSAAEPQKFDKCMFVNSKAFCLPCGHDDRSDWKERR